MLNVTEDGWDGKWKWIADWWQDDFGTWKSGYWATSEAATEEVSAALRRPATVDGLATCLHIPIRLH